MIVLASASPARSKLLTEWGINHQIIPSNIDEAPYQQSVTDPKTLVETLAKLKANAITSLYPILAADTIVVFDHQIIGKPQDRADAKRIITLLQGNTHQVWTGVCFDNQVLSDTASVTFKPMTESDIETYLNSYDWVGAAGAYRIQQAIKPHIKNIDGDINTVIGLPSKTLKLLKLMS